MAKKLYECIIIDTEFTETCQVEPGIVGIVNILIDTYSKRNLNVPANLALYMRFIERTYILPIWKQITYHRDNNPKFSAYEKDIQKYLSLV